MTLASVHPMRTADQWSRLKTACQIASSNVDKLTNPDELPIRLCNYMDVYKNDVIHGGMEFMGASATTAQIKRFTLRHGDVIITKDSETRHDIAVPAFVDKTASGIVCGYHLAILRPALDRVDGKFIFWALKAGPVAQEFSIRAQGVTRFGLTINAIGDIRLPIPAFHEQRRIAEFLDHETAKIDALVAKQKEFLTRLDEHRRALTSELLMPRSYRQSEGSGKPLPIMLQDCDFVPIKRAITLNTSGPRGWSDFISDDGDLFFQSQNIGRRMEAVFEIVSRVRVPAGPDAARASLRDDDVTVCITGARTSAVAHISRVSERMFVNQHVCLLRPDPRKIRGRFLAYCLWSPHGQHQLSSASYGLKQGLSLEDVRSVFIPLPMLGAQDRIIEYLDNAFLNLALLEERAKLMIDVLIERRSALITAAITGHIDVTQPSLTEAAA